MPGRKRAHYTGNYQTRARAVRKAANRSPNTRCMHGCACGATSLPACRCGQACARLLIEHKLGDTWDAGHAYDGDPASPLRPETASCNRSGGARLGNTRRASGYDWP